MSKNKTKNGHCIKCGTFRNSLHRDHVIPKWNGGEDIESNVQYLCANCHEEKTQAEQRTPEYAFHQGQASKKRWAIPEMHAKIEASMQGVRKSEETRKAMSVSAKAYRATPEGKADLAKARESVRAGWTLEARANAAEVQRKRFSDPVERAKAGEKNIGVTWSEERKAAFSLNRTGRTMSKREYRPRSDQHSAAIADGRRKRQEFLASLTPQQLAAFHVQEAQTKLDKLNLQLRRQTELKAVGA